jgi:hypothetical protein
MLPSKKINYIIAAFLIALTAFLLFLVHGTKKEKASTSVLRETKSGATVATPIFTCHENVSNSSHAENKLIFGTELSCYAAYYRTLATAIGISAAITDVKTRMITDPYVKEECHEIMHVLGRSTGEQAAGAAEAFKDGDTLCGAGYFHGVMEGLIQKHDSRLLPTEFLDSLCAPFQVQGMTALTVNHFDCAHGLGHGIMYVKNNELFEALSLCDTLSDTRERNPCWTGVFMENAITDFKDHHTKYLKSEDPMYPCDAVKEAYKSACYSFQTSYILKTTKSFKKTFTACRAAPYSHQAVCFQSIGRDVAGTMVREEGAKTKENCSSAANNREAENCVIGAVEALMSYYRSDIEGLAFCSSLPENLQKTCSDKGREFYERTF